MASASEEPGARSFLEFPAEPSSPDEPRVRRFLQFPEADAEPLVGPTGADTETSGPTSGRRGLTAGERWGIAGLCLLAAALGAATSWRLRGGGDLRPASATARELVSPPPHANMSMPWLDDPPAASNPTAAHDGTFGRAHNGTGLPDGTTSSHNGTSVSNGAAGPAPAPTQEPTPAPTPIPTVQPLNWFHPVDGGSGRSCRMSKDVTNKTKPGLPGSGAVVIEVAWPLSSLEDCKSACVNASVCRAIEFDSRHERCQVWSIEPEFSVASEEATCLAFRPENSAGRDCPAAWPKPSKTWCAKPGENCMPTGCCEDPGLSCFAKDGFWAACKPVCEPGQVDVVGDAQKYQTPWSCGLLGCGNYPGRFVPPGRWWSPPESATQHNGVQLSDVYIPGSGSHRVFIIGDWGGFMDKDNGNYVSPASQVHQRVHGEFVYGVDDRAQFRVRDAMVSRAAHSLPDYVLNVGDNFYWAGVEEHCNSGFISYTGSQQFELVYESVYVGPGIDGKQWLGVLGNHDYGGYRFEQGWDKAIGYTWASPTGRWMTPALYYNVKVWYHDFAVDYIFMDTNVWDALDPADPSPHNICSQYHNPPDASCDPIGPTSVWDCPYWFKGLWDQQKAWLEDTAPGLDGDWRIVVTHFPPYWGYWDWQDMARRHEIDLMITGHRHSQHIRVPGDPAKQIWPDDPSRLASDFLDPTAYVVSGGGGGVTSEQKPEGSGEDDEYGFMEMTLSKDSIRIESISHGGQTRRVATMRHEYAHNGSRLVVDAA